MQQLVADMEDQLVTGGQALEDKDKEYAKEQRRLQLELEEEQKKQAELLAEKQRAEEEMLEKDKQYNSLQEEVEAQRKIIKRLRQKYRQAKAELNDIEKDQEDKSEEYLDTIRAQEKDLDFLNAVVAMMLKDGEMYKLKEKIDYDFEAGKWKVPPFIIKNKEVAFPQIKNAMNFVKENLDQREIVMADSGEPLSDGSGGLMPSKRDNSRHSRQFNRNEEGGFRKGQKGSRNDQFDGSTSKMDSPSGMQNFHSPFGTNQPNSKGGIRNKFQRS